MANQHGDFVWYELITPDPDAAQTFYGAVLGWQFTNPHFSDRDYRYGMASDHGIVGIMRTPEAIVTPEPTPMPMPMPTQMPSAWLGYVGVSDVDTMVTSIEHGGGTVILPPFEVPNIGRMALIADAQGAMIYVINNRDDETSMAFSADIPRIGHCAWNELSTTDPSAAHHFYGTRFGWVKDGDMDMGPMGKYEFLRHGDTMIGAVMPKVPEDPMSHWLYYFRVGDIDDAATQITRLGGRITQPPIEIPGGTDFSLQAQDPHHAYFGLVGARKG